MNQFPPARSRHRQLIVKPPETWDSELVKDGEEIDFLCASLRGQPVVDLRVWYVVNPTLVTLSTTTLLGLGVEIYTKTEPLQTEAIQVLVIDYKYIYNN